MYKLAITQHTRMSVRSTTISPRITAKRRHTAELYCYRARRSSTLILNKAYKIVHVCELLLMIKGVYDR